MVLSCEGGGGRYDVALDQTCFFPEGGGQAADAGTLDDLEVSDVREKDGVILHRISAPLPVGKTVTGRIDWAVRFPRMQNHSGEHLVSGIIHRTYGYDNVGFHMGEEFVLLDVSGKLSDEQIRYVEQTANTAVCENREVTAFYPGADALRGMDYRSKLDNMERVRIVTIDGYDCCACCAPHVNRTGEIGLVKVLNYYPYKGGTRIEMLCGADAFSDYQKLHAASRALMTQLSSSRDEIVSHVVKLKEAAAALREENTVLRERLAMRELELFHVGDAAFGFVPDADHNLLRHCLNQLADEYGSYCLLFSAAGESGQEHLYVVSGKDAPVKALVGGMNKSLNGRGGGKDVYAQGKVLAGRSDIAAFLETRLQSNE